MWVVIQNRIDSRDKNLGFFPSHRRNHRGNVIFICVGVKEEGFLNPFLGQPFTRYTALNETVRMFTQNSKYYQPFIHLLVLTITCDYSGRDDPLFFLYLLLNDVFTRKPIELGSLIQGTKYL